MNQAIYPVMTQVAGLFKQTAESMNWTSFTTGQPVPYKDLCQSLSEVKSGSYHPDTEHPSICPALELQGTYSNLYWEISNLKFSRYAFGDMTEWVATKVIPELLARTSSSYKVIWTKQLIKSLGVSTAVDQNFGDIILVSFQEKQCIFIDWKQAPELISPQDLQRLPQVDLTGLQGINNIAGPISPDSLDAFGQKSDPKFEAYLNQQFPGFTWSFLYVCSSARSEVVCVFDAKTIQAPNFPKPWYFSKTGKFLRANELILAFEQNAPLDYVVSY